MDMLDWLKSLDPVVQGAIISGVVAIIVAVITGIFTIIKRSKDSKSNTVIKQKQWIGNRGTQIGVQNNYGYSDGLKGEEKDE